MGKYRSHSNERHFNDASSPNRASSSSSPSPTHENVPMFPIEKYSILAFSNAERERENADPQTPQHLNPKAFKAITALRSAQVTFAAIYLFLISPEKGNLAVYMTVTLLVMIFVVFLGMELIRNDRVNMKPNYQSFAETFLLVGDVGLCAFFIYQMNADLGGRLYTMIDIRLIYSIVCALNAAMFLVTALYSLSFKITLRIPKAMRLQEDLGDLVAADETYDEYEDIRRC
jgi:hypothetical protein